MKAPRARRLFALSAAGVLLAGGAAIGAAGTASAATPQTTSVTTNHGCGWWSSNCYGHRGDRGALYGPGYGYGYGFGYNQSSVVVIVL
ncbi:hypothetical protein ABZ719_02070 [Streptomyces sp. NPDC006743]|uniref:hypothetical protein n=1 Tax=Streptomyces sp. NPDC006743 TaxID=3154480 RepID=UPI0034513CFE|nr:hypothetical protein StreXyl84_46250 [Streptomyces sp. Xyl84]